MTGQALCGGADDESGVMWPVKIRALSFAKLGRSMLRPNHCRQKATALAYGLSPVSRDRHFARVPELAAWEGFT